MKLKEFQQILKNNNIDYTILFNHPNKQDPNFQYFSGINSIFACLAIPQQGKPKLFASIIEVDIAKKNSTIKDVITITKDLYEQIRKNFKGKKIGLNYNYISLNGIKRLKKEFKGSNFFDISKHLTELRITKTKKEIEYTKKSCTLISNILTDTIKNFKKFKTEIDVREYVESKIKKLNLELSFPIIVASGPNSKNPHHFPINQKLKGFTILDMGVKYKGYCSDITRTIYVGKPSKQEIETYNLVLNTQLECINNIPKLSPAKLHDLAVSKLGKHFIHALGHGTGIEIHEDPSISTKSKDKLKPGMIITIEPGHYNKFGIRIEDDILITKKGYEILTNVKKELIIV